MIVMKSRSFICNSNDSSDIQMIPFDLLQMSDLSDSSVEEQDGVDDNRDTLVFDDNHYQETTLTRLNRLRKAGQFCDVSIEVDGNTVPAHRVILACASKYMFELFKESETDYVKVDNIDYHSFCVLLDYAYTSR